MKKVVGRVVVKESQRGVPDLIVNVVGTKNGETTVKRLGAVITDGAGSFALDTEKVSGSADLISVQVLVTAPADGGGSTQIAASEMRQHPGDLETFVVRLTEATLKQAGISVPSGLPPGVSEPLHILARAGTLSERRASIHGGIAKLAAPKISLEAQRARETESSVRLFLLRDTGITRRSESLQVVGDGQRVLDVMHANVQRCFQRDIVNALRRGTLAVSAQDLEPLRQAPNSNLLKTAEVEGILFGSDPTRDDLTRSRTDLLGALARQIVRKPPVERPGDPEPQPDQPSPTPISLPEAVAGIIDAAARGVILPGQRGTPGSISEQVRSLTLRGGVADQPAYFDFSVLSIAFDHLWRPRIDRHLVETAVELHDHVTRAGGNVSDVVANGMSLFDALRTEAQGILAAGVHASQFFSGRTSDAPDVDVSPTERRMSTRDHRGIGDIAKGFFGVSDDPNEREPAAEVPSNEVVPISKSRIDEVQRLRALVSELDRRLSEPYSFDVFAADDDARSINFGHLITYRQKWDPVAYQAGQLVKTITLAPREERTFSTKRVEKSSSTTVRGRQSESQRHFETTDTMRDVSDIVAAAKTTLGFTADSRANMNFELGSGESGWSVKRDSERSSQETRQAFREAVRKAAQDNKESSKLEVTTTESLESSVEETGKLVNPNDEIPVTYLFFELQRRFLVRERIHKFTPVILVAQEVPAPHEITRAWLLQQDWILAQVLLDESFRPALQYLSMESAGAELKLRELGKNLNLQRDLVKELKKQITILQADANNRYQALARAVGNRGGGGGGGGGGIERAVFGLATDAVDKVLDFFGGGGDNSSDAARAREEMARDAYERATRAEREARERLASAVSALDSASQAYVEALATYENNELAVLRLRVHVKQNILHYMKAIWDQEPRDQRVFRLHNSPVPAFEGTISYELVAAPTPPVPPMPPVPPLWEPAYKIKAKLQIPHLDAVARLGDVADLDQPLGYRGNYMIFPLRQHNALTKFLSVPYADSVAGLRDPDDLGNFSLSELDTYIVCLRDALPSEDFDKLRPKIEALYAYILQHPYPNEEEIVVPSGSLFIESLPGTAPVLEDYKLLHRIVDVAKAAAEVRQQELENLRYAARIQSGRLEDPEIQTVITTPALDGTTLAIPANGIPFSPPHGGNG